MKAKWQVVWEDQAADLNRMVVVGMKFIASVSFGKDSLAMLLRLLEEQHPLDAVVFYDTGMEFDAIYRIRDRVKQMLSGIGVDFIELHPDTPFLYSMLERPVKSRDGSCHQGYAWCGGRCRWGTSAKTAAIRKFKKSLSDDVIDYVGIAADEPLRFEKAKSDGKLLPLVEWNMTEADCLEYCRNRGWNWIEESPITETGMIDLYDILDRVSCWCCANKNLKELQNIYRYLPQYWSRLEDLQCQIDRPFKGFYKGEPRGIFELKQKFACDTSCRGRSSDRERGKYQQCEQEDGENFKCVASFCDNVQEVRVSAEMLCKKTGASAAYSGGCVSTESGYSSE